VNLRKRVIESAVELGFNLVGIAPAVPSPQLNAYLAWISAGMHGTLAYMARDDRVKRRRDLNTILPGARSLVVVGLDYAVSAPPADVLNDPTRGRISNYAWGADYHTVMLPRLLTLCEMIARESARAATCRVYVDTGAILERSHAATAGIGFVGKNTMLISPRRGSYLFLGEIITDAEIEPDSSTAMPGCGRCTRCLEACPTAAFPAPYVLDARLCISYLTIELRDSIPHDLRPKMRNWVYGCDICQAVCPWQRFSQPAGKDSPFHPIRIERAAPSLDWLLRLGEREFEDVYRGSPIERITRERFIRNACVAAGNSGAPSLSRALIPLLSDPSAMIRGHAAWALGRLRQGKDALRAALSRETDPATKQEIDLALKDG